MIMHCAEVAYCVSGINDSLIELISLAIGVVSRLYL